jgi:ADP-ribose pyrophosphatase
MTDPHPETIKGTSRMPSDMLTEITLSSEPIYEGRVVRLRVDQVRLPNGNTAKREVIRHPGAVAIVAFDADGKVLLVRQYRHAAARTLLEIPAGTLEPGEDPLACAIRELQEETGYKPGKIEKIGGIYTAPGYTSEFIHLYLATDLNESRLAADEDEFIEVLHVPFADALQMIQDAEIADGKSVSGLLLAQKTHPPAMTQ